MNSTAGAGQQQQQEEQQEDQQVLLLTPSKYLNFWIQMVMG